MALIDDIAQYLEDQSVGTVGTNIFKSWLPDNDLAFSLAVLDTGGPAPDIDITSLKSPTIQVLIRAEDYSTGKTKLAAVRSALHGIIETTVGSSYILYMHALSEGGHIGRNERGQDEFSINFLAKTR